LFSGTFYLCEMEMEIERASELLMIDWVRVWVCGGVVIYMSF